MKHEKRRVFRPDAFRNRPWRYLLSDRIPDRTVPLVPRLLYALVVRIEHFERTGQTVPLGVLPLWRFGVEPECFATVMVSPADDGLPGSPVVPHVRTIGGELDPHVDERSAPAAPVGTALVVVSCA